MLDPKGEKPNSPKAGFSRLGDDEIVGLIDALVEEEHQLERDHTDTGLDDAARARLQEIEVRLDQAWDLLRQRRARRDAGLDPAGAQARDPEIVERYEQ